MFAGADLRAEGAALGAGWEPRGDGLIEPIDVLETDPGDWSRAGEPDAVSLVSEVSDMMAVFAAERLARIAALLDEQLATARLRGNVSREIVERSVRLEIACALRVTEHAAGRLLTLAEAVAHRYRPVLAALAQARITERHAELLVDVLETLPSGLVDGVLPRSLALAFSEPVGVFRRSLARLVDEAVGATRAEKHRVAVAERRVVVEQAHDGMSWLSALIPSVEAHAIHQRLTAMASALAGDREGARTHHWRTLEPYAGDSRDSRDSRIETRTLDQRRADILCDLLIDGDTACVPPAARGIRANVVVTVPVLALLTEGNEVPLGCDAPTVEGIGPVPLPVARELCGGAPGWTRVLTHPETGMVLSVGRDRYDPPPSLRRLVKWRAERCMAPGCGIPASRCQIDHTIDWAKGGPTSLENNAPLCQGHHTIKHHGDWTVRHISDSGGALEWTSPAGRRYVVPPERRVPAFRPTDTNRDSADAPF